MLLQSNRTVLEGKIQGIRPRSEGRGAEIDLKVLRNLSPSRDADFLRPEPGAVLTTFFADPLPFHVGARVKAKATLLAGPRGGRIVLESIEPLQGEAP